MDGTWSIEPCKRRDALALAAALGISETTASVLVRRGYADPDEARRFLAAELPTDDPFALGQVREACETIRAAIEAGKRICVHGDYDVDGICATTLAVHVLRELGADVEWHLPSRFDEGYGVSSDTIARLAAEGCGLVLTVDCGVTAVDEVAEAKAAGLDVVVTDHHRAGETLPDCPVVGPYGGDYPCRDLCGTGVVYKLGQALLGADSPALTKHLDLVALATIADVVPLVGENRALATAGLRALARTQKPGLQALMRAAHVDPATADTGTVGFRLAPRINAAGRLCKPGEALDLLLTEDRDEAWRLAQRLEELNRDRQQVEDRILREAVREIESWPEARRRRRGYVVAGEGWHEGVIGIVASRLVERYHRPIVMIASAEPDWKGSGRSLPGFDLHAALGASAEHLTRWGGHAAAAGLSVPGEHVADFAERFETVVTERLGEEELAPVTHIDAIVPGNRLTLSLCAELEQLAPFGLGNPAVTLLLPAAELGDLGTVGEGKHLRFRVRDHGRDAGSAIAFRLGPQLDRYRRIGRYDVAFRLQENRWNGTVAPQLVVRRIFDAPDAYEPRRTWLAEQWRLPEERRDAEASAVFAELELEPGAPWRSLLESPRFRALLADPPLAHAA